MASPRWLIVSGSIAFIALLYWSGFFSSPLTIAHQSSEVNRGKESFERPVITHQNFDAMWSSKRCDACSRQANPKYYSQYSQDKALWKAFYSKPCVCNGIYIELGAFDGVNLSNTKFFHDTLMWKGVLIEPLQDAGKKLLANRPGDYVYNHYAVCPPGMKAVNFSIVGLGSHANIGEKSARNAGLNVTNVDQTPCFPGGLGGILKHAGIQAVDFLSLDVEDSELIVLQTIDWDVPVGLIMIEMHREARVKNEEVRTFLKTKGYEFNRRIGMEDELFAKPEYLKFIKSS